MYIYRPRRYRRHNYLGLIAIGLLTSSMVFLAWLTIVPALSSRFDIAPIVAQAQVQLPVIAPAPAPLPSSFKLAVPYSSQAPKRQWGEDTYENGCEETSLLMVNDYYQKKSLDADIATTDIKAMVDWQKTNWGAHKDLTVWQVVDLANGYYGPIYQSKVYTNPTEDELKKEISSGHPVIIATMSHSLGNPYFGPNDAYHMLVLTGYDGDTFIANDPGVNPGQGLDYHYTYTVLDRAMGAQVGRLPNQDKVALVIYPK